MSIGWKYLKKGREKNKNIAVIVIDANIISTRSAFFNLNIRKTPVIANAGIILIKRGKVTSPISFQRK